MIKWKKLKRSFRDAFCGVRVALKAEQSFRIQMVLAGVVVIFMLALPLLNIERAILVLVMGLVLGLELLNSQLEDILDLISQKKNHKIKKIKDLSAAAVLVSTIAAIVIGLLIFLPYIF